MGILHLPTDTVGQKARAPASHYLLPNALKSVVLSSRIKVIQQLRNHLEVYHRASPISGPLDCVSIKRPIKPQSVVHSKVNSNGILFLATIKAMKTFTTRNVCSCCHMSR